MDLRELRELIEEAKVRGEVGRRSDQLSHVPIDNNCCYPSQMRLV